MYEVKVLPAFEDNYLFVVHNHKEAVLIDPAEPKIIESFLEKNQLKPLAILNTHHHPDHTDGNVFLQKKYSLPIFCSKYDMDRIPGSTQALKEGDSLSYLGTHWRVLQTPAHTLGHLSYYLPQPGSLFCGDTLFSLGCGRLFEGTPELLYKSLEKFKQLPDDTKIYCSHEYSLANADFCLSISQTPELYRSLVGNLQERLCKGEYSIPSTLSFEKEWNPFLHLDEEKIKTDSLGLSGSLSPLKILSALRKKKDVFVSTPKEL